MENGHLPTSLREVESLITQLYSPGAPERVANIQETLQRLQRSPEGWQLATSLLGHGDEQVRFFAALTFTVKLNTDAKSLSDEDAQALLQTLIGWLIRCLNGSESALVVRKLCSTLVAYFLQFSSSWERCIKHLMLCLCSNEALPYAALESSQETVAAMVDNVSNSKTGSPVPKPVALFWFAATLVEEVGKTDSNSMKQHKFHLSVVPNVDDIVPLISKYITDGSADMKIRQEAMRCFQSWVSYSHRAFVDAGIMLDPLQSLTQPSIMCLGQDDLYEITIELLSDVLTNYSKFLRKEDFTILQSLFNSQWAQERYERLVKGDFDFDSLQFGMFMIAFGDATVQDLARNCATDPQSHQYLSALCDLLGAEGYAVSEDKIYVPALEFWNTFVETMVDDVYSCSEGEEKPSWFLAAQEHVKKVIERCWIKSQFPPAEEYNSWDSVDRTGFKDARRDFSDLLQQFYLTTGIPLLQFFIDLLQNSTVTRNWAESEASMYCLMWFADCVYDTPQRDDYLDKLFTPSLLTLIGDSEQQVPTRAMKSFLDLVIAYPDYFKHHPTNLPAVLNIVFSATSSTALAKTASRSIMKLCSDCRTILIPELGAFLQHYGNIASNYSLDGTVKEAVMEGIASIIQGLDSEEAKLAPLEQLLDYVQSDVEKCLQIANGSNGGELTALDLGIIALKCLAGMSKGIQAPEDKPVDLEKIAEPASPFWITGKGSHVQHRIYLMMHSIFDVLGNQGDIVEELCLILRHGFREEEPGPFVLPSRMAAQFLMKANSQTPRLGRLINTAAFLITTQKLSPDIQEILETMLNWVSQILQNLGEPGNDPEIAQASIEFLQRLLSKFSGVLLDHQPPSSLEFMFMFALKALAGTEPLPKASSADFWATFIALPTQPSPLQPSIENAVSHLGPLLAQALIYNIGGHAARSELEKLSDPIKKLVVRQVHAKAWFEAALFDANFPSEKVTAKDKNMFLAKIVNLRGAKGTNQVVRDFWLLCRGSNFAYAS
ncbi:hypothetical protein ONS95_013423 [Cadophora gregata]|uniref:uncharacterized protein n=1 Tax=Cadophora gregata TaxID=51156 RepID=UPI0026DB1866|nr:uncharacterized protein ONS95_013423 [Cadophora gregata]KAK0099684.1 hypothetical protein ONS96_008181 [Cadophora gregata f. sp. sojae]KAK0116403.1 hypothetical protein ONS95_013423 [Cadophora gregata]